MANETSVKQSKVDQEILDAKQGLVASLSNKAAARYLGVSVRTLFLLVESGDGPPVYKALATGSGKNQHKHFPFRELEQWNEARIQYPHPRKTRLLRQESERAQLRHELWDLEQRAEHLRKFLRAIDDPWAKRW
ncbi:hypothetical protein [Stenotrophomonas sp. PS02297]|uniref:hypothetical protein n=1 Tax=Stenotrophomonas sp. PS02297 TaxID=2991423 RepID=UPI00249A4D85|nr:hypothetical protein [Stenotrophomonas sp. PS02297]